MNHPFKGTGVAVITPFHTYGTIDFNSLENVLNHIIDGGVEFVLCLGTTSESATLSKDEKSAVINYFVEIVNKRVPIMLGIGGNNTQEVINCIKSTDFDGIESILSVAPYYNKPGQKGLYYHFKNIASASPVPVFLYNVPSRTNVNIKATTTLKLAHEMKNIIGIKEASGDFGQIMQIIKNKPKDFTVLSGDDAITLPMLTIGAEGVISVVANAFPREFSDMVRFGMKGNLLEANQLHYKLIDIIDTLFEDGNPSGVKAALDILGISKNNLRLPLVKVNKRVYNQLSQQISEL
ncbi:MAG: 4-hydroxy-tetrahydrodipicolinate synthase [Bacteroidales bacterium]|nr:4-hydroxy-tetrahydrodipicolinate synthase [Bacteroidales bacterium]